MHCHLPLLWLSLTLLSLHHALPVAEPQGEGLQRASTAITPLATGNNLLQRAKSWLKRKLTSGSRQHPYHDSSHEGDSLLVPTTSAASAPFAPLPSQSVSGFGTDDTFIYQKWASKSVSPFFISSHRPHDHTDPVLHPSTSVTPHHPADHLPKSIPSLNPSVSPIDSNILSLSPSLASSRHSVARNSITASSSFSPTSHYGDYRSVAAALSPTTSLAANIIQSPLEDDDAFQSHATPDPNFTPLHPIDTHGIEDLNRLFMESHGFTASHRLLRPPTIPPVSLALNHNNHPTSQQETNEHNGMRSYSDKDSIVSRIQLLMNKNVMDSWSEPGSESRPTTMSSLTDSSVRLNVKGVDSSAHETNMAGYSAKDVESDDESPPVSARVSLSDNIVPFLLDSLSSMDAYRSPRMSKSGGSLMGSFGLKFHAKYPLPGILFCVSHKDAECLAHWMPIVHVLTDHHLFVVMVALTFDPWGSVCPVAKEFVTNIYPRMSLYARYLIHELKLFKWMDAKLRPLEHFIPDLSMSPMETFGSSSGDPIHGDAANPLKQHALPILQSVVRLMEKESAARERYLASSECVVIFQETVETQREKYARLFSIFKKDFLNPGASPAQIASVIYEFLGFAEERAQARFDSFSSITKSLIDHMAALDGLDSPFAIKDASLQKYFDVHFCDLSDPFYFRMIDQARHPFMSFKLGKAAIDHRRLDILTTMIRDEGFLFFSSPTLIQGRRSYANNLRSMEEYNILLYAMRSLLRRPGPPVHSSWGSTALPFLQSILENGGLRLVYPEFLSHAVRLHDLAIMQYLVHDLGITEGLQEAATVVVNELGEGNAISTFLTSQLKRNLAAITATSGGDDEGTGHPDPAMASGAELSGYFD